MTKADKSSKTGTENPQLHLATVRSLAILTRPTWMNWLEEKSDQWGFRKKMGKEKEMVRIDKSSKSFVVKKGDWKNKKEGRRNEWYTKE